MGTYMSISSGLLLYLGTVYMLGKESLGIITSQNASVLQPHSITLVYQPVNTERLLPLCPFLCPPLPPQS